MQQTQGWHALGTDARYESATIIGFWRKEYNIPPDAQREEFDGAKQHHCQPVCEDKSA
jgi:hypothetical protein